MKKGKKTKRLYPYNGVVFAKRLKNARLRSGMTLVELASAIDHLASPVSLSKYENGKAMLKAGTFYFIFKALDTCPNDFVKPFREDMGNLEFRKSLGLGVLKSDMLEQQVAYALERYLDIEEILEIDSSFHNPIEGTAVSNMEEVNRAVYDLRQAWELGMNALPDVTECLEAKGIKIVETTVDPSLDALACWAGGKFPLIAVNKELPLYEKRLVMLRELGHLLLDFAQGMNEREVERFSLDFASALLIPFETFSREMGSSKRNAVSIPELLILQETYGIPTGAILDRALALGSIGRREHARIKNHLPSQASGKEPYGLQIKEGSKRFKQLVLRAASEELIDLVEGASFLNVEIDEFNEEFIIP